MKPAIVVVTYNRANSLRRLLNALSIASYTTVDIPLVISIDFQNSENHKEVLKTASDFNWQFGEKRIIEHKENLGLRKHILGCGNLSEEFGSIIMLEDDIYVSPQFYDYSVQMLAYYENKEYVAGISLYKHLRNVNVNRTFTPQNNGYDVFLMQFAQSWGQCWSVRMWKDFYSWYLENQSLVPEAEVPTFVSSWPESSWLKYFIKYVIKKDKYFVYPYESLSTNFTDTGTHNKVANNVSQVPLQLDSKKYNIPTIEAAIKYDAFFERQDLETVLSIESLCVDLYGAKKQNEGVKYLLSMKHLPYEIVGSYGLNFRPHELNVILKNNGNDIFLYDTSISKQDNPAVVNNQIYKQLFYDYSLLTRKNVLHFLIKKILKL